MDLQTANYINVNGRLLDLRVPRVMGILNLTPDSFYAGSRVQDGEAIVRRAEQIVQEGGDIIDVGACSTRPGSSAVSPQEERMRLRAGLALVRRALPDAVISVDTFRADVARMCVEEFGVAIVNDIAGGGLDAGMFRTVAGLHVPYVLTHMKGTPQDMQRAPHYDDLQREVCLYFASRVQALRDAGAHDIILDPGFGFGKTLAHNYRLLAGLEDFRIFGLPLLAGVSRKSMVYGLLGGTPDDALNGTTVLHTICLLKGVNILRVHDVHAAVEAVRVVQAMREQSPSAVAGGDANH